MPLPRLSARPPGPGQYTNRGSMIRWITFYHPPNPAAGAQISPFVSSWAAMRSLAVSESDKAQQIVQRVNWLFTTPYQPGIKESMLIGMWEQGTQRMFQIAGIDDVDGRQMELRVTAFEINQNAGGAS